MTDISSAADLATILDNLNAPGLSSLDLVSSLQSVGLLGATGGGSITVTASDATGTTSATGHQVVTLTAGTNVVVIGGNAAVDPVTGNQVPLYVQPTGGAYVALGNGDAKVVLKAIAGGDTSTVDAGSGNSFVAASGHGSNVLWGGTGNDTLVGNGSSNIAGGTGQDTILAGNDTAAHDTVFAGAGGENIILHQGGNLVYGNANATITAGHGFDTIDGGRGPETIFGGGTTDIFASNRNEIHAQGNDTITTGLGKDTIFSGAALGQGQTIVVGTGQNSPGVQTLNLGDDANGHGYFGIDTIFGGDPAHVGTVKINQAQAGSTTQVNADNSTTITFGPGGPAINVHNVNIVFSDDKTNTPHLF